MSAQLMLPPILDACCGPRMMWFDSDDRRALYIDKDPRVVERDWTKDGKSAGRKPAIVAPDIVADFTALPFPDESFYLVVLDPPPYRAESNRQEREIPQALRDVADRLAGSAARGIRRVFPGAQAAWRADFQVGRALDQIGRGPRTDAAPAVVRSSHRALDALGCVHEGRAT